MKEKSRPFLGNMRRSVDDRALESGGLPSDASRPAVLNAQLVEPGSSSRVLRAASTGGGPQWPEVILENTDGDNSDARRKRREI